MKYFGKYYPFMAPEDGAGGGDSSNDDDRVPAGMVFDSSDDKGDSIEDIFSEAEGKFNEESKKEDGPEDDPKDKNPEGEKKPGSDDDPGENTPPAALDLSGHQSFKIGERELTQAELQLALNAYDGKEKWMKDLTQKSQMMNWFEGLPAEQQEKIIQNNLALVYGRDEMPGDYQAKPFEFDVNLSGKDEFDADVSLKGKHRIEPGSDEWNAMAEHFEEYFKVKYGDAFSQIKQYQENNQQFVERQKAFEKEAGQKSLKEFISGRSLNISTDGDIGNTLSQILLAGETHPSYADVIKLQGIGAVAEQRNLSLEAAADILYGKARKADKSKEQAAKDRKKQSGAHPEPPGGGEPAPSADDQFLGALANKQAQTHNDLWSGKLQ